MNNIVYQTTAIKDIVDLIDYHVIECDNPAFAEKLFVTITNAISNLKEMPLLGTLVEEYPYKLLQIRKLIVSSYVIFYKYDSGTIYVIRVLHCRQEWQEYL